MLHASEGGSFSVGHRKFKIKESVTPPPAPLVSGTPVEGIPVAMPAKIPTERIARRSRVSPLRMPTLAPATDKMVVSKSVIIGFCLTSFAGGVVITLAVDRVHARANDAFAHAPEPVLVQTTQLPDPAPAAAATTARSFPVAQPATAAPDPVVVQLPHEVEKPKPIAALPPARAARPIAPAPARAPAPRTSGSLKKANAVVDTDPTEAAPDDPEDSPALPAPVKKKWVDPFDP